MKLVVLLAGLSLTLPNALVTVAHADVATSDMTTSVLSTGSPLVTPVTALLIDAERQAHDGNYAAAIDTFKAADRIAPHASNACAIARAYADRERWAQAELFLHACHDRATAADPTPASAAELDARVAAATGALSAVEIRVIPDVPVALQVASFGADEPLSQRTIHLPVGHDVITAEADGYEAAHVDIQVADHQPIVVTIELRRPGIAARTVIAAPHEKSHSYVPWLIAGTGGAVLLGGIAADLAWVQPTRNKPMTTGTDVSTARGVSYGMVGVGAAAAVVGMVLHWTVFKGPADTEMHLSADTVNAGAVVQVRWTR